MESELRTTFRTEELLHGTLRFFQDPVSERNLTVKFQHKIFQQKISADETIKIWVCDCLTAEDVYSIALFLTVKMPKVKFQIYATDFDQRVLKIGANGVYPMSRFSEIPISMQSQVCIGEGELKNWFSIPKAIRDKVIFKNFDVVKGELPEQKFDLLVFRLAETYQDETLGRHIYDRLLTSLNPHGILISALVE